MKTYMFLDHKTIIQKKESKQKLYVDDIKFTLHKLNLFNIGKKKYLLEKLLNHYDRKSHYELNQDKIEFIQKTYRKKLYNRLNLFYSQFTNSEDFYTLDSIKYIEKPYLFWYSDLKQFKYAFDIRSFKQLIINKCKNPYTREDIPVYAIEKFNKRILELNNKDIKLKETIDFLTEEQIQKLKIVEIFQTMDELNIVAGGINQLWFSNFTFQQLRNFYKILEDVWNYRSELSYEKKIQIVPNNNIFKNNMNYIFNLPFSSYTFLQTIILDEIKTLITSSDNLENRKSGGYYVLIALTEVSDEYLNEYPWLKQ
jgi:hypothetical protein